MNEKMSTVAGSNNGTRPSGCDRAEELVTYLYGESTPQEAKVFRQHLTGCAACHEELAAFGSVREAVGEWREQALGALPSLGIDESFAGDSLAFVAPTRKRSAVAALREFFSLSPMWLQAGAFALMFVFFALAALTLVRAEVRWDANGFAFNTGAKERIVEKEKVVRVPVQTGLTQDQVESQIAAAKIQWELERSVQDDTIQTASSQNRASQPSSVGTATRRNAPGRSQRSQLAKFESSNEDFFNPNEERMPRLTDLLGEVKASNKTNEQ